jgi:hypothetical protein
LLLRLAHQNRHPSSLSCLSHHHFAEVLAPQQRRKSPDGTRVRLTVACVPAGERRPPHGLFALAIASDGRLKIPQKTPAPTVYYKLGDLFVLRSIPPVGVGSAGSRKASLDSPDPILNAKEPPECNVPQFTPE